MEQRNITADLVRHAQAKPDAPALLLPDREISYLELNDLTWKFAQFLHEQGVRAGHVVGLTFAEELTVVLAMLALTRLGATVFSIPRSATPTQRVAMAARARVAVLATDQPDRFDAGVPVLRLDRHAVAGARTRIDRSILSEAPSAPWLLITGSGTMGRQKLIPVTHSQEEARSSLALSWLGIHPADRISSLSHFDFAHPKHRLNEALRAGASYGVSASVAIDPLRLSRQLSLTVLHITVYHAENMLAGLPRDAADVPGTLRTISIGASTVSDELRQRIRRSLCPDLRVRYATNESGPISVAAPPDVYAISGTVGTPLPGLQVRIVDRSLQPLPAETIGLIRIKGPGLIDGYVVDDDATWQSFQDGWFLPGDLGKLTRDGQLIHCGRADDMMIMNGINIYPAEMEQTICGHPAVRDAAAMPLRHKVHQDVPVCAVALHPGADVSERTLLSYARERLGYRSPHRVVTLDRIPRGERGKLDRPELSRQIAGKLGLPVIGDAKPAQAVRAKAERRCAGQLAQRFNLVFSLPKQADLARLDKWLAETLEIHVDPPQSVMDPLQSREQRQAGQWLWRALLLVRELMQAGRVPVFDSPTIMSLAQNSHKSEAWNATVALPLIDHLPLAAYREAIKSTFNVCAWAASNPFDGVKTEEFFVGVEKQVIGPLLRVMPAGKSTLPVLRAAYEKGVPIIHLGGSVFQLGWGSKARRIDRSATELDSAMGSRLSHSKVLTAQLLRAAGLPAPEHQVIRKEDDALIAAQRIGWPVVVKPADRDRGEGVTVDVADERALRAAFRTVASLSGTRQVIVERQVQGVCHRLFVVNGKLLYAVKRLPMSIRGDGKHTVAELVNTEVRAQLQLPPWKRSEIKPLDELARAAIAAAGHAESSVPAEGVLVPLRRIESTKWGGVDEEVTNCIHPENLRIALGAAELLGLHVVGIDIITGDITRPWFENGAVINEVNFAPLLGGGEISRRHIPAFLEDFIDGNGRISVEVFVGGDAAWRVAAQRWRTLLSNGANAYLTNAVQTLAPSGEQWTMPFRSAYRRARALVLSAKVGGIVLVVQTDEFLYSGLPLEAVDAVTQVDAHLVSCKEAGEPVPVSRLEALARLLEGWERSEAKARTDK